MNEKPASGAAGAPSTVDDNATCRVPADQRKSTFNVAMVAAGYCICMSGLFTGASMAAGLNFIDAIWASVIGNIILSLYGGALGMAGAREGVATSMLARHSFGREGSKIISLVLALSMGGWYSVQVGFFGDCIAAMFPHGGFLADKYVAAFWGGILMLITAYYGYKGLSLLSTLAVPLIVITAVVGVWLSVDQAGGWAQVLLRQPASSLGLGAGVVMAVGSFAGGAAAQADITRYAVSTRAAVLGTVIGYMGANVFIILAGFITNMATGIGDLPSAMIALGMGVPAMIVLIGAQWTTNANNLYTSTLGLSNILPVRKGLITLVVGVVATCVGAAGLSDYFTNWLIVLGIALPPMAGVVLADYFFVKKMSYNFGPGTRYCGWNLIALASWALGCIAGAWLNIGIACVNSLIVALIIYIPVMRIWGLKGIGLVGTSIEQ